MYSFTSDLDDLLLNILISSKYATYRKLFNVINDLNDTVKNPVELDLSDLESELTDIIYGNESEHDTCGLLLDNHLLKTLHKYCRSYGIVLSTDCTLNEIEKILFGYHVLINPDQGSMEYIQMMLEDIEYDDDTLKLSAILSQYTSISEGELYTLIEDCREDIFEKIQAYYDSLFTDSGESISEQTHAITVKLTKIDANFNNCYAVKDLIQNGYKQLTYAELVNDLYGNINRQLNTIAMIPYEIVAILYIAIDTREDMLTAFNERFNMDALSYIKEEKIRGLIEDNTDNLISMFYGVQDES